MTTQVGYFDETSRLLSSKGSDSQPRVTFLSELKYLSITSAPVAFSYALQNSLQTLSVLIVGQLNSDALSCAAFSYMIAMCTTWTIALGGGTALDTLASSLFSSSSASPFEVGIVLQRAFIILFLLHLPFALLWCFISPVLLALGQTPQLASDVQSFLRVLCFGAPGYIAFESVKKYLQVQGIMHASTLVLLITSPLNVLLNWYFIFYTPLALLGAPVATSLTYWISFGLLCAYCKWVNGSRGWGGWNRKCLKKWSPFVRLAIPGILHVGTEWWAFEIVALVAGILGPLPLAAQSVIMTVDQILNTIPMGIGVSTSVRIGTLLGSRSTDHVRLSSHTAVLLSTIVGLSVLIVLMCTRDSFGLIFTDDKDVVELVSQIIPYVAAFQVADGWAQSCGGVLRGMGKQGIGAGVNLVAYYLMALPLGIWLAFNTSLGLAGLWIGQCAALFLVGIGEYILVALTRWDVEIEKAEKRNSEED